MDELEGLLLIELNQTPNADTTEHGSRTPGDEFRGQKGNSPDHRLRSQNPD